MALCLSAGALAASLAVQSFTLAWNHSVENLRWEEDWRIEAGHLTLAEARIRGTGAGMEPPEGAVLRNGIWHYRPAPPNGGEIRLGASRFAQDYEVCFAGACRHLAEVLPREDEGAVVVSACGEPPR